MSETSRKRLSSDRNVLEDIKHMKTDCNIKENVPPHFSGTVISSDNNICLQDTRTEITTPKKSRENLKEQPVTPSTNFKLLVTLAAKQDYVECVASNSDKMDETSDQIACESNSYDLPPCKVNRKEKSLAIICTRFLRMYPSFPSINEKIIVSLDEVSAQLGVERRRLYDIVNVFESINLLTKNAKNQYLWFGKNNLEKSLYKLKAAAIRERILEKLQYVLKTDVGGCKQSCILNEVQNFNKAFESSDSPVFSAQVPLPDMRREKSLGIMSQKFLMLFLVSPNKIISLGVAAKVLNGFLQRNERAAQIKTQIRRLYDVANVLSSIGLIQKETAVSRCGRKPAFKYIGPDLKNIKDDISDLNSPIPQPPMKSNESRGLVRHPSFQEICEVAEIEHQRLNLIKSHNSAPPFESALIGEKGNAKTSFENLHLNSDASTKVIKNNCPMESKPKIKTPVLIKPNIKVINIKKPAVNPTVPCYILNSVPIDKSEIKYTNAYGSQTFLLLNTIAPSKEAKAEASENQPLKKVSSQQTITLSSEQRDAILQSLNISLSSQQVAAIHLDGASRSNSPNASCNIVKIINKNNTPKISEDKNAVKFSSHKDVESNTSALTSVNNTRSNTPSSTQTLDSPLSIPSGYVTPIPNVSSDISFISNTEIHEILKNIENQSNYEALNSKNVSSQENVEVCSVTKTNSSTKSTEYVSVPYQNTDAGKKVVANSNLISNNLNSKINCSTNQASQLISNDSCSNDSINLEVSNIFKGKNLGDVSMKSKPFLIDEKTILSPINTPNTTAQILVPSTLITPPHIVPETIFVFSTPPGSFQTTKVTDNSNIFTVVPNPHTESKTNDLITKARENLEIFLDKL